MKKVFFGPGTGIWKYLFFEFTIKSSNIEYCDFDNKINNVLKRVLMSTRFNIFKPQFIKRAIYKYILGYSFLKESDKSQPILFAFTNGYELWADINRFDCFLNFLRKEFPNAKFAIHFMESLQSHKNLPLLKNELETLKKFDLVLTFNFYDADEFGFEYYPACCENCCVTPTGEGEQSDLFYAGGTANPNRIDLALSVFKKATDKGLKCIFFFSTEINAPSFLIPNKDKNGDYYVYGQSKVFTRYIPYSSSLAYIKKTKAMLEIVLPVGFASSTVRPAQCMNYKVKLLTNCPTATKETFYSPNNISVFNDENDIDFDFFDLPFEDGNFDFSAPRLFEYIEKRLYKD